MVDTEVEAKARAIYEQFQADHLNATLLCDISGWVRTGAPPSEAALRNAGFSGDTGIANADDLRHARKSFVRNWGFSIPCREAIEALRGLGPLLEVGAGSGYWSAMVAAAGHDVIATDIGTGKSVYGTTVGSKSAMVQLNATEAVKAHPERDVFCSWPAAGGPWLAEALNFVRPGRAIALILDERPDVTGDRRLGVFLAEQCAPMGTVSIPQFPGVRDRLVLFRRR